MVKGHASKFEDPELALRVFRTILLARRFEEQLITLFAAGRIKSFIHSGIGQEATGAAAVAALREHDYLVPSHRARAYLLAKGMPVKTLAAEIYGKRTGCCLGLGGEAHVCVPELRILGSGGIIASQIAIAVGIAYAARLRDAGEVVLSCFGDGATSRGGFHEAVNMAAVMDLPVVFLCENNLYAEFSRNPVQMRVKTIAERAAAYGIPGVRVDGTDACAVYSAVVPAVARARAGEGPTLIEAVTPRWRGHYEGDPQQYRPPGEREAFQKQDCLAILQRRLQEEGLLTSERAAQIEGEVCAELDEAIQAASSAPDATFDDLKRVVYA